MDREKFIILILLYIAFIALGLPDQLLGVAWPTMRADFGQNLDAAGVITFSVTMFSAFAGFVNGYIAKKFPVSKILVVSVFLTAVGSLGYALSPNWCTFLLFVIPTGLGAGSVDSSLNNYVALNYSSRHMSWLHGFWGIGSTIGPLIMTFAFVKNLTWRGGYAIVGIILLTMSLIFMFKNFGFSNTQKQEEQKIEQKPINMVTLNTFFSAMFFFFYTATEGGVGLWIYSVMTEQRGFDPVLAGTLVAIYWGSLTFGRFMVGFITKKLCDNTIILGSILIALVSMLLLCIPTHMTTIIGLVSLGVGLSGIYPCTMNATHSRYEIEKAKILMGHQVGSACLGFAIMTPLLGIIIQRIGLNFLPVITTCFVIILLSIELRLRNLKA